MARQQRCQKGYWNLGYILRILVIGSQKTHQNGWWGYEARKELNYLEKLMSIGDAKSTRTILKTLGGHWGGQWTC